MGALGAIRRDYSIFVFVVYSICQIRSFLDDTDKRQLFVGSKRFDVIVPIEIQRNAMNSLSHLIFTPNKKTTNMRILAIMIAFAFVAMAAPPKKITIQTNAQCGMCKATIEKALSELEGVKVATLDLTTKEVTVKFSNKKVSLDNLRQTISKLGYQADDLAPDQAAQAALSACCQPKPEKAGGCCSDKKASSCAKKES